MLRGQCTKTTRANMKMTLMSSGFRTRATNDHKVCPDLLCLWLSRTRLSFFFFFSFAGTCHYVPSSSFPLSASITGKQRHSKQPSAPISSLSCQQRTILGAELTEKSEGFNAKGWSVVVLGVGEEVSSLANGSLERCVSERGTSRGMGKMLALMHEKYRFWPVSAVL